jgi:hypothetical protein
VIASATCFFSIARHPHRFVGDVRQSEYYIVDCSG